MEGCVPHDDNLCRNANDKGKKQRRIPEQPKARLQCAPETRFLARFGID